MTTPLAEREYHPLPDPEPPKWWQLREQAREGLRSAEVPNYRIDQILGKNTKDFEKMNRLRQEAGMEPVEGMLDSLPYVLGSADAALGLTSLPAFTKTLGSMALPYAAMGIESALGFTDALKGIKDYPEDAPKDWRYRLMQAALPLTALGGGMAATRFLPKGSGKAITKTDDFDKTRRNILKGTGAIAGLATLPPAVKFGMKAAPTAAKIVPAAAAKSYMHMFGPNLTAGGIGNRITDAFTGGFGDVSDPNLFSMTQRITAAGQRQRFLTDDFEIIPVNKSIKETTQEGNLRYTSTEIDEIIKDTTKILQEDSITGDLKAISQSGKDHFKNYDLGPDEIQIIDSESFNVPGILEDVGGWKGSEKVFAEGENLRQLPRTSSDFDYWEDLSEYIRTNGTKMGEAKPLTDAEMSNPGGYITDIKYYELDGIPVALGHWTDDSYGIPVILSPNTKGMDTLMGITKKAEGGPIDRLAEIELEGM